jgi:pimeloyl-ACP methyl ester carboxylesterase
VNDAGDGARGSGKDEIANGGDCGGEVHHVDNGAGWRIALKRVAPVESARTARTPRPVLLIPGYQMNSFIFGFHPRGASLESYLASRGLEVWSVDLRGQGRAERVGGHDRFGLAELAVEDLGTAIGYVRAHSKTRTDAVDLIGCSLGTALAFAHVACAPTAPVETIVSMGGLVTWVHVHRALRVASHAPWLVARIRMNNTRALAARLLPLLVRWAPSLLSVYLNAESTDTSQADVMAKTVEDANPTMNREIAEWIARGDLVIRGVNVSRALPGIHRPFLCVVANHDGIVPPRTSRATFDAIGSEDKKLLCVGDERTPIAHADLFLANIAPDRIFRPIADFLLARA